jgi:hypothetical protein
MSSRGTVGRGRSLRIWRGYLSDLMLRISARRKRFRRRDRRIAGRRPSRTRRQSDTRDIRSSLHTSGGVRTSDGTVSGWRVGLGFITTDNERAIDFHDLPEGMDYFGSGVITGLTKELTLTCINLLYHVSICSGCYVNTGKPPATVVGVVRAVAG